MSKSAEATKQASAADVEEIVIPPPKVLRMMGLTKDEYISMKRKEQQGTLEQDLKANYESKFSKTTCKECRTAVITSPVLCCWMCSYYAPMYICERCQATSHPKDPSQGHLVSREPLEPQVLDHWESPDIQRRGGFPELVRRAFKIYANRPLWAVDCSAAVYFPQMMQGLKEATSEELSAFPAMRFNVTPECKTSTASEEHAYQWLSYREVECMAERLNRNLQRSIVLAGPLRYVMILRNELASAVVLIASLTGFEQQSIPIKIMHYPSPWLNPAIIDRDLCRGLLDVQSPDDEATTTTVIFCYSQEASIILQYQLPHVYVVVVDRPTDEEITLSSEHELSWVGLLSKNWSADPECPSTELPCRKSLVLSASRPFITLLTSGTTAQLESSRLSIPRSVGYNNNELCSIIAQPAATGTAFAEPQRHYYQVTSSPETSTIEIAIKRDNEVGAVSEATSEGEKMSVVDIPLPPVDIIHEPLSHLNGLALLLTSLLRGGRAAIYSHIKLRENENDGPSLWSLMASIAPTYFAAVPRIWQDVYQNLVDLELGILSIFQQHTRSDESVDEDNGRLLERIRNLALATQLPAQDLAASVSSLLPRSGLFHRIVSPAFRTTLRRSLLSWFRLYVLGTRIRVISFGSAVMPDMLRQFISSLAISAAIPLSCKSPSRLSGTHSYVVHPRSASWSFPNGSGIKVSVDVAVMRDAKTTWIPEPTAQMASKYAVPIQVRELYGTTELGTMIVNGRPLPGVLVRLHVKLSALERMMNEGQRIHQDGIWVRFTGELQVKLMKAGTDNWHATGDLTEWYGILTNEQFDVLRRTRVVLQDNGEKCIEIGLFGSSECHVTVGRGVGESIRILGRVCDFAVADLNDVSEAGTETGHNDALRMANGEFVNLTLEESKLSTQLSRISILARSIDYLQIIPRLHGTKTQAVVLFMRKSPDQPDDVESLAKAVGWEVDEMCELVHTSRQMLMRLNNSTRREFGLMEKEFGVLTRFSQVINLMIAPVGGSFLWIPIFTSLLSARATEPAQKELSTLLTASLKPRRLAIASWIQPVLEGYTTLLQSHESSSISPESVETIVLSTLASVLDVDMHQLTRARILSRDSICLRHLGLDSISAQRFRSELRLRGVEITPMARSLLAESTTIPALIEALSRMDSSASDERCTQPASLSLTSDSNQCTVPTSPFVPQTAGNPYNDVTNPKWWERIYSRDVIAQRIDELGSQTEALSESVAAVPTWTKQCIFITGTTGFLGAHILASLIMLLAERQEDTTSVCALVREASGDVQAARRRLEEVLMKYHLMHDEASSPQDPQASTGTTKLTQSLIDTYVTVVPGDVSQPNFGMSLTTLHEISSRLSVVIHAAANVNHVADFQTLRDANGDTAAINILSLCHRAQVQPNSRTPSILLVSTVDVLNTNRSPTTLFTVNDIVASFTKSNTLTIDDSMKSWGPTGTYGQVLPMLKRVSGYAATKWLCEQVLNTGSEAFGIPLQTIRLGHIGPGLVTGAAPLESPDFLMDILLAAWRARSVPSSLFMQGILKGVAHLTSDSSVAVDLALDVMELGLSSESTPLNWAEVNVFPVDTAGLIIARLAAHAHFSNSFFGPSVIVLSHHRPVCWDLIWIALVRHLFSAGDSPPHPESMPGRFLDWVGSVLTDTQVTITSVHADILSRLVTLPDLTVVVDTASQEFLDELGLAPPILWVEYWKRYFAYVEQRLGNR